jgi:hypothetical protein
MQLLVWNSKSVYYTKRHIFNQTKMKRLKKEQNTEERLEREFLKEEWQKENRLKEELIKKE